MMKNWPKICRNNKQIIKLFPQNPSRTYTDELRREHQATVHIQQWGSHPLSLAGLLSFRKDLDPVFTK
jgi:hypothetical protein